MNCNEPVHEPHLSFHSPGKYSSQYMKNDSLRWSQGGNLKVILHVQQVAKGKLNLFYLLIHTL